MGDPDCIFCKVVAGEIPAVKVFEAPAVVAFMDIGPLADGHVLVIPTGHYATLGEMPADETIPSDQAMPAVQKNGWAVQTRSSTPSRM